MRFPTATAHAALQQPELEWLPLTAIRGQTTHLPTPPALAQLSVTLCDQGYLPPARAGLHCLGASFGPGDAGKDEREAEHAHNIDMVKTALPDLDLGAPDEGWWRCFALCKPPLMILSRAITIAVVTRPL